MKRSALLPAIVALVIAAVADAPRLARAANGFDIKVLSNRADLISGGDALVEIVLPDGVDPASVRVDVDGRNVTAALAVRPHGRDIGLITGLAGRSNGLTARGADGARAAHNVTRPP